MNKVAKDRGEEWQTIGSADPLSKQDMDTTLQAWKDDFPMRKHTREKTEHFIQEIARQSKHEARKLRDGACAAYVWQTCVHKQLAMSVACCARLVGKKKLIQIEPRRFDNMHREVYIMTAVACVSEKAFAIELCCIGLLVVLRVYSWSLVAHLGIMD